MKHVEIPRLDREQFRIMLMAIDRAIDNKQADARTVMNFSSCIEQFTGEGHASLMQCDPATLEAIRETMRLFSPQVDWIQIPGSGILTTENLWQFMRTVRNKAVAVANRQRNIKPTLPNEIRRVLFALVERLPAYASA